MFLMSGNRAVLNNKSLLRLVFSCASLGTFGHQAAEQITLLNNFAVKLIKKATCIRPMANRIFSDTFLSMKASKQLKIPYLLRKGWLNKIH